MTLSKKQQSFIKNNLASDILEACSGDDVDNVVKFKVVSSSTPQKQEITDLKELHEIALRRKVLWEIVQKSMKVEILDSGQEVIVDPITVIEAIHELNLLDGHLAPEKFEHTYIVKFVDGEPQE